eukprot:9400118-Ditylum_brightwellii.AAC.1
MPYKADDMKVRSNSNKTWWWTTWPHWLSHGSRTVHNIVATVYIAPTVLNRTPPGTFTAVEREEAEKIYLKAKGEYDDHNTMQELLKAQIQEA